MGRLNALSVSVCLTILGLNCATAAAEDDAPAPAAVADAVERRQSNLARQLISQNADIHVPQADGMTALHWAVYHDDTDMVRLLIDRSADVSATNRYDVTALSLACLNGNADIVDLLLTAGADPNVTLPGGETALMTASRTGRLKPVQLLLSHGATVDARESRNQTALMWAAAGGHADVVETLIAAGASFDTALKSGFTPLFFAVRDGKTDVVLKLLQLGADVNETMAPASSSPKSPRSGMSPLVLAVENGHFDLAAALLEAGADPNDQRSGFTALHTITWVRKPNRGDSADGDPAPIGSGNMTSLEFVRVLVHSGANVNERLSRGRSGTGRLNHTGATPFLMAADTADIPLMRLLLELGADPMIPNADGCPPILAAAGIGSLAPGEEAGTEEEAILAVQLLLDQGANINTVDENGETAMHGAAYKSLPGMVEFLADHGASIEVWNRPNKYSWTPLLIAQGFRPGNFKPAPATIQAIESVMLANGVTPPPAPRRALNNSNYKKPPERKDRKQ